jgi:hypothetical protein
MAPLTPFVGALPVWPRSAVGDIDSLAGFEDGEGLLVRLPGTPVWDDEWSEVCQYYAFFCGPATPQREADLARRLADDCRPGQPKPDGPHPVNAVIGFYLRLELLSQRQRPRQIAEEMQALFLPMAQQTGTWWENDRAGASACHGFASHVWHVTLRDLCAIAADRPGRVLHLGTPSLPWVKLTLPPHWQVDAGGQNRFAGTTP